MFATSTGHARNGPAARPRWRAASRCANPGARWSAAGARRCDCAPKSWQDIANRGRAASPQRCSGTVLKSRGPKAHPLLAGAVAVAVAVAGGPPAQRSDRARPSRGPQAHPLVAVAVRLAPPMRMAQTRMVHPPEQRSDRARPSRPKAAPTRQQLAQVLRMPAPAPTRPMPERWRSAPRTATQPNQPARRPKAAPTRQQLAPAHWPMVEVAVAVAVAVLAPPLWHQFPSIESTGLRALGNNNHSPAGCAQTPTHWPKAYMYTAQGCASDRSADPSPVCEPKWLRMCACARACVHACRQSAVDLRAFE